MKIKLFLLLCVLFASPLLAQSPHAMVLHVAYQSTGTSHGANLTWTASTTPGTLVTVQRSTGSGSTTFTTIASGVAAGGPYLDTTVVAGVYTYQVIATENGASSLPSTAASITISPQPPTGLTGATQ